MKVSPGTKQRSLSFARKASRAKDTEARPFKPTTNWLTLTWTEATEENEFGEWAGGNLRVARSHWGRGWGRVHTWE
jgi:muramoyltetrapeptide carboxypeptidase LdcA involved in peptidoglycan recycling